MKTPLPRCKISTDQGPIEAGEGCPDFARLVASLTRRGAGQIEFVRLEHSSGGVLTLGAKTSRDGDRLLRFRHSVPDGSILCTKRVAERRKLVSQLAHFFKTGARGDYLEWIPTKSLIFDAEELESHLQPLLSPTSPASTFQTPEAASMRTQGAKSFEGNRLSQEDARATLGMRIISIAALSLILATVGFETLFKAVNIRQPATEVEIIGLHDHKELLEFLRQPVFAADFSNLVVSAEQLALAAQHISARDNQLKELVQLDGYGLVRRHSNAAVEQAAELVNVFAAISLKSDLIAKLPRLTTRSAQSSQIVLPARDIASLTGLGYWDALRLKDRLNRETTEAYSPPPTDPKRSKLESEMSELGQKARRLEAEVRANAASSISKSFAEKLSLLRVNEDSDVPNLNRATKQRINALERRLLEKCRHSLVFQNPLNGSAIASEGTQFLIVFRPVRQGGEADIVFCGAAENRFLSSPNGELLFDFLKREFSVRE